MRSIAIFLLMMRTSAAQPPPPVISADDREVLARGMIDENEHGAGVVTSVVVGFGLGQAIQGRWHDTGWIYTLGDSLAFATLFTGFAVDGFGLCFDRCSPASKSAPSILLAGAIGLAIVHSVEIGDAIVVPILRNRHYRAVVARYRGAVTVAPYVTPLAQRDGAVAGISLRF